MPFSIEHLFPEHRAKQQLCEQLRSRSTLTTLVLSAWQMGLWVAKAIVEQQLAERTQVAITFGNCPVCHTPLVSKGFVSRQILTLVGLVRWKRRVSRCPRRCSGSRTAPFDIVLGIDAYQQTSTELIRLGCLLAVFLPFGLAAILLQQLSGITVSENTIWNWVQVIGQQAQMQIEAQLKKFSRGEVVELETVDPTLMEMPLVIAADGVTVPFRSQPLTPKGRIVWKEVKVALFARLGKHLTKAGKIITRLHQPRLVAVLGDINDLKPRLQMEAHRQGITQTAQVAWISEGARGFWRLYQECFADCAVGILDFYHAAQHLWKAASAYQSGNPARTP